MALFYGVVAGTRGKASRCGGRKSGIKTIAASWVGAVEVDLLVNSQGQTMATVRLIPWRTGNGGLRGLATTVYQGPVNPENLTIPCEGM